MAAAVVPEARELNSFLLSVATEFDTVVDPLLRELDQRADAVRVGHAALDLPCLANEAPTELPKDNNYRLLGLLVFQYGCLASRRWKRKLRRTSTAQQRE